MTLERLNDRERKFAEEHHRLLLSFLRRYGLDDEFYGALSVRYLLTVHRYLTDPKLRRYSFSTVLWLNLRSELSHELRRAGREPKTVPLDDRAQAAVHTDEGGCREVMADIRKRLKKRELELITRRVRGESYREIACAQSVTDRAVDGRLYRIRKKIRGLNADESGNAERNEYEHNRA